MENQAIASAWDLQISTKHAVEICDFIRGRTVKQAKTLLNEVLEMKRAVPFKKHNRDVAHKPGRIMSGRYPQKATKVVLELIEEAESNAQNKGLSEKNLFIKSIFTNKGSNQWRYGRLRRRKMKRTHLQVILEEKKLLETQKTKKVSGLKKGEDSPKEETKKEKDKK